MTTTKLTGQELLTYLSDEKEKLHTRLMLCEGAGYESNLTEFYLAVIEAQKANAMQDPNQSSDWYESLSDQRRELYEQLEDWCPQTESLDTDHCDELMDELAEIGITTAKQFEDRYAWHDVCSQELAEQFFAMQWCRTNSYKGGKRNRAGQILRTEYQIIWDEELSSKFQYVYFDDVAYFFSKEDESDKKMWDTEKYTIDGVEHEIVADGPNGPTCVNFSFNPEHLHLLAQYKYPELVKNLLNPDKIKQMREEGEYSEEDMDWLEKTRSIVTPLFVDKENPQTNMGIYEIATLMSVPYEFFNWQIYLNGERIMTWEEWEENNTEVDETPITTNEAS